MDRALLEVNIGIWEACIRDDARYKESLERGLYYYTQDPYMRGVVIGNTIHSVRWVEKTITRLDGRFQMWRELVADARTLLAKGD